MTEGSQGTLGGARGAWIAFSCALVFYVGAMSRVVYWGDAAEFSRSAATLELSPSARAYPLHRLLCWTAGRVVGDPALGSNIVSALFAAVAVALAFASGRRVGKSTWAGVAAACALGLAHTFWLNSVVAAVCSLSTTFLLAAMFVAVDYDGASRRHRLALGLILGIALLHHRSIVFAAPGLVACMWIRTPVASRVRAMLDVCGAALVGAVPFALLCVFASRAPPPGEASPFAWWFQDVFLGGEANARLMLVEKHKTLLASAVYCARWLAFNLPGPALALAAYGFVAARRHAGAGVLALLSLLVAFNLWFPLRYDWTGDQYKFLLPLYPVLAVAAAIGVGRLVATRGARVGAAAAIACGLAPALLYAALAATSLGERAFPGLAPKALRDMCLPVRTFDTSPRDESRRRLAAVARNALLHCDWGDGEVFLYLQEREHLRPDVEIRIWYGRTIRLGDAQQRPEYVSIPPFTRELPPPLRAIEDRLGPEVDGFRLVR